jgi:glycosyltransferase involved in cell wall biosynthesis
MIFLEPKISVIIPIYNAEKYLAETLDSVLNQTYPNIEIIAVLDAPMDNSEKILKSFKDKRIKIVRHKKNSGLSAARNTGVKHATGDYIHFLDSDDTINPKFYWNMVRAIDTTCADVATSSVFYEKKPKRSIFYKNDDVIIDKNEKQRITHCQDSGWAWRYLIKRRFYNDNKFSFPDLVPLEDLPFTVRLVHLANMVVLSPGSVLCYKNRDGSILNQKPDPKKLAKRKTNRHTARKMVRDFLRENKIKRYGKIYYFFHK